MRERAADNRSRRKHMTKPLIQTTGRRKRAVARVRVRPGSGKITINSRSVEEYFPSETHRMILTEPLRITNTAEVYDVDASIDGGGVSGQAGALRHGIARALADLDGELRSDLKRNGFLTRDAREKESKKYGLKKARKAPQYSKR
jgi:small subunit ribosomal protein S9